MRYRRPYAARHTSVSWNLMIGRNALLVAKEHGHRPLTMLTVYAAWTEGAPESDIRAIRHARNPKGRTALCHLNGIAGSAAASHGVDSSATASQHFVRGSRATELIQIANPVLTDAWHLPLDLAPTDVAPDASLSISWEISGGADGTRTPRTLINQ